MGNLIIGQSGGPTAVINSSLAGAIKAATINGVEHIYGMRYGIEGFLQGNIFDLGAYFTNLYDLSLLKRTPAAFLGSCRYKLPAWKDDEATYKKIFDLLEEYKIDKFLYIGGNDSMDTIQQLYDYAVAHGRSERFVGIPKTIDNDLPFTDHTPGYGSAAKFIATSMKEMIQDNESFGAGEPRIAVVEVMGRNAGWLTGATALSKDTDCGGPDLIYLPELPFDEDDFTARVEKILSHKKSIVVAASEGLRLADGTLVCNYGMDASHTDAFGHQQLSGVGRMLANALSYRLGCKSRAIEFSLLQRCATHMTSRTDIDEAYNVGYIAASKILEGETGTMVTIQVDSREPYVAHYEMHDVHGIANVEKKVPLDWITEDGTYVTDEFINYVKPLVIGMIEPHFAAGLPKHLKIK